MTMRPSFFFSATEHSFFGCPAACEREGGPNATLAVIGTALESDHISRHVLPGARPPSWIGLFEDHDGSHIWLVDGEAASYTNWDQFQPKKDRASDHAYVACAYMGGESQSLNNFATNGKWGIWACTAPLPCLCERLDAAPIITPEFDSLRARNRDFITRYLLLYLFLMLGLTPLIGLAIAISQWKRCRSGSSAGTDDGAGVESAGTPLSLRQTMANPSTIALLIDDAGEKAERLRAWVRYLSLQLGSALYLLGLLPVILWTTVDWPFIEALNPLVYAGCFMTPGIALGMSSMQPTEGRPVLAFTALLLFTFVVLGGVRIHVVIDAYQAGRYASTVHIISSLPAFAWLTVAFVTVARQSMHPRRALRLLWSSTRVTFAYLAVASIVYSVAMHFGDDMWHDLREPEAIGRWVHGPMMLIFALTLTPANRGTIIYALYGGKRLELTRRPLIQPGGWSWQPRCFPIATFSHHHHPLSPPPA